MQNLIVDAKKVQLVMARKAINPYDLCSSAQISYASYRRIMKEGRCKLATLGKISTALGVDVLEIIKYDPVATSSKDCPEMESPQPVQKRRRRMVHQE